MSVYVHDDDDDDDDNKPSCVTLQNVVVLTCTKVNAPNIIKDHTFYSFMVAKQSIPVAAPSKAWVYGPSFAGIVGSNPVGGMDVCLL
jgi:hypothetical protein